MGLIFGESEREKRRKDYEDWHNAREHARASAEREIERERMWDEREERERQENHKALTDDLNELKDEFSKAKEMEKFQDKLETILSIYAKTETIKKQANRVGDSAIPDLVKTFQAKLADTIALMPKPNNREELLRSLQLLTGRKISAKKIKIWKKELAQQVRAQHSDDSELLMYCDKVLGKVIPADASFGTKLKIILGNLLRK